MVRCFHVDLKIKDGYTRLMAFAAMKQMQHDCDLIDESTTLSDDYYITLTAGFYENYEDYDDLFMSVLSKDKEMIKKHVKKYFPNIEDPDTKKAAIKKFTEELKAVNNICESTRRLNYGHTYFYGKDLEELYELAESKRRIK